MTFEPVPGDVEGVQVVRAHGELDVVTARTAMGSLPDLVRAGSALVLDLSEVTFFDSSGVRLVDALARQVSRQGNGFRVVAPTGSRARRVLDLVGMSDPLVCDDVATAIEQARAAQ